MTLRIFERAGEIEAVVALHGWLSAPEVPELERLVAAHHGLLQVDLAHLVGVDAEGLRVLKGLRTRGVRITGASPYVELLLERTRETGK